ncbi:MAG TPA: DUF6298 domain-containing protein, partial [Tepidisphaeraceae bacterium]|nr:DUF6298 domain-containing protein [Tepidisphaeraceae bacterium]
MKLACILCIVAWMGFPPRTGQCADQKPIALDPDDPHYFLFRGRPAILVGSTEHYGAVLNRRFDQTKYLDTLKADGLNLTRTFSGVYREVPGSFHIEGNTLAPDVDAYLSPWARSDTPGARDGRNKFDLAKWNEAYFGRLKSFVVEAGRRGIVVEYVLFCPFYEEAMWNVSPMNVKNNVNGAGAIKRDQAYTLHNGKLLGFQDAFVRKAVTELRDFDNVYYEICNEPYFGGVSLDWQQHIAQTISDTESQFAFRHLIAQNIANGSKKIENPDPLVSIFNFHYANPPVAVSENFALSKAISYDETGFKGTGDSVYRVHGWEFLLAGGAVYDNLDYSFTLGHEDGSARVKDPTPGGGGQSLRLQLKTLRQFVESFQFVRMHPADAITGLQPAGTIAHALAEPGRQYAIYFRQKTDEPAAVHFRLDLPAGEYRLQWLDPASGKSIGKMTIRAGSGATALRTPEFQVDLAAKITRVMPEPGISPSPRGRGGKRGSALSIPIQLLRPLHQVHRKLLAGGRVEAADAPRVGSQQSAGDVHRAEHDVPLAHVQHL